MSVHESHTQGFRGLGLSLEISLSLSLFAPLSVSRAKLFRCLDMSARFRQVVPRTSPIPLGQVPNARQAIRREDRPTGGGGAGGLGCSGR